MTKLFSISIPITLILFSVLIYSCKKDKPTPPIITTIAVSSIKQTTAISGGNAKSDGGDAVTARGVCWNATTGPTTALISKTIDGTGTGIFTSSITGLTAGTTYYVKAYATNSAGTAYGNEVVFNTKEANGNVTDIHRIPGNPNTTFDHKILDGYFVTSIAFDSKGNAWIGTFNKGLIKYNSNETIIYNSSNSLIQEKEIWDIAVDSKDNVWIGCNGIIKFDGNNFMLYNSQNTSMPEDVVFSIAIDSKDNIWFTSCVFREGGIVKFDGTTWTVFTPDNSNMPDNLVHSIAIDHNDNVWLALGGTVGMASLVRISGNKWTSYSSDDIGFSPYYFGNIDIDSHNEVCASIDYTLSSALYNSGPQAFVFNGSSSLQLKIDSLTNFTSLKVDNEDNIWCNTGNGFAVYNWDKWIINDSIFNIYGSFTIEQAPDNKIWIGTGDGVFINN